MGLRGPAPTPTPVLAARGSWRAKLNKNEPTAQVCVPEPPQELQPDERKYYDKFAASAVGMGLLTEVDGEALLELAVSYALFMRLRKAIHEEGDLVISAKGTMMINPAIKEMGAVSQRMAKGFERFGLTPSARARLTVGVDSSQKGKEDKKPEEGKGRLLNVG